MASSKKTSGKAINSDGKSYEWKIIGFGNLRGGRWREGAPTDATLKRNKMNPNWGMIVKVTDDETGGTQHRTIVGGYEPDTLPAIIEMMVEDYG